MQTLDWLVFVYRFLDPVQKYVQKYSRMDQVKFFEGCHPQILFCPFLNTLSHM